MMHYNRGAHDMVEIKKVKVELHRVLEGFRRQGLTFKTSTSLAKQVSMHVGRHYTNLMRNHHYRRVLEDYLMAQSGKAENIPDELATAPVLLSKLRTARLEISNLKARLNTLEKQAEKRKSNDLVIKDQYIPTKAEVDFSMTCDVLHDLLERLGGPDAVERDNQRGLLIDKFPTGGRDEIIGGKNKAKPYLRWCRERVKNSKIVLGVK